MMLRFAKNKILNEKKRLEKGSYFFEFQLMIRDGMNLFCFLLTVQVAGDCVKS